MKKDIGFWDKDGNYIEDYQEIDEKELKPKCWITEDFLELEKY